MSDEDADVASMGQLLQRPVSSPDPDQVYKDFKLQLDSGEVDARMLESLVRLIATNGFQPRHAFLVLFGLSEDESSHRLDSAISSWITVSPGRATSILTMVAQDGLITEPVYRNQTADDPGNMSATNPGFHVVYAMCTYLGDDDPSELCTQMFHYPSKKKAQQVAAMHLLWEVLGRNLGGFEPQTSEPETSRPEFLPMATGNPKGRLNSVCQAKKWPQPDYLVLPVPGGFSCEGTVQAGPQQIKSEMVRATTKKAAQQNAAEGLLEKLAETFPVAAALKEPVPFCENVGKNSAGVNTAVRILQAFCERKGYSRPAFSFQERPSTSKLCLCVVSGPDWEFVAQGGGRRNYGAKQAAARSACVELVKRALV